MNIERLFATADMNLAMGQTGSTFPFLRELANFVVDGGRFPQPPGKKLILYLKYSYMLCMKTVKVTCVYNFSHLC